MHRQGEATPYKRPLLAAGLTAVAVTAVALQWVWWLSLSCVLLLIGWFVFRRAPLCVAVAVLFFVTAMGYRHGYVLPTARLDGQTDTLSAVVVEHPAYGQMYTVRVTHSTVLSRGTRVMLWCNGEDVPRVGGTVSASVRLYAVTENQRYYASQGAFVCAFAEGDADTAVTVTSEGVSPSADGRLRVVRALMAAPRRYLGEAESAILSAMCFGERSFLSDETAAAFRSSGSSHLLVVSGLHLSMVALAVRRFFRRLGMRWACVLTILAVWLFAWLVDFSPSIVRAAVMCTVWLMGCLLFCRSDGLNSLGLAALLVLAGNPCTLWNVGFQLSFAATLGVLWLAPRLTERGKTAEESLWHRLRRRVSDGAAVCVSALLFTLPIAAYHYGGFPLTSIIANILAVPAAGAVLLLGWLGSLCGAVPFLGWLSLCILRIADGPVRYLAWVAEVCSPDWAWLTVSQQWEWLLLLGICAAIVFGIGCGVPSRRVAAAVTALVVLAAGVGYPLTVSPVSLIVVPSDNECGVILRQGTRCALLLTHAGECQEITYAVPPFTPDVIVVGEGEVADFDELRQFPGAQVLSTVSVPDRHLTAALCPVGTEVELWRDCRLIIHPCGWWRLQMGAEVLWIATDPTADAPNPDEACMYVGGTPTRPPRTAYTVVCSGAWLSRHRPDLTGRETFVIETPITWIPHKGEWRMSLWL